MSERELEQDLMELSSAEDFLEYFDVEYEPSVVQVNRLHILQRFHDYLGKVEAMPEDPEARFALHSRLLKTAYEDFVKSNAVTEKVFKVFHSQEAFVPLTKLSRRVDGET